MSGKTLSQNQIDFGTAIQIALHADFNAFKDELIGLTLTTIDASIENERKCKAVKDLIKKSLNKLLHTRQSNTEHLATILIEKVFDEKFYKPPFRPFSLICDDDNIPKSTVETLKNKYKKA